MIRPTIAVILMSGLLSCDNRTKQFPYLPEKLNESAEITRAEHIALAWERNAPRCYGPVHAPTTLFALRIKEARVGLGKQRIDVQIELDMDDQFGKRWRETSTEEDRVRLCEEACKRPVKELARELECDSALINLSWGCVDGEVTSPNCNFMRFTKVERPAAGQPATRPESK